MISLDGIWEFGWTENVSEKPVFSEFASVPGCFDAVGLRYNRRGAGWYRRKINISAAKQRLKVASFGLRATVFIDGKEIADSYLAWSPLTVDFSAAAGEHELMIRVDNFIEGHPLFIDRYDFYGFGGIYDHVTLGEVPEHEIKTLEVITLDYHTGEVLLRIDTDADRLKISFDDAQPETFANASEIRLKVPDFKLWSPETPFLHRVRVNERTEEFGIRKLDWSGAKLKLNGKELRIFGVNRHESHPEFGAATPEQLIFSDLQRIKSSGLNFIRGCHYPQREFFFKCCDRLGLLVWEEPLSWGNKEAEMTDMRFQDTLAEQLELTIKTSFNHPSLIIHGVLNECASDTEGGFAVIKRMMELCRRLDPSRPATFASNRPRTDISLDLADILCYNIYPGWYGVEQLSELPEKIAEFAAIRNDKPLFISEIGAAAMYGFHSAEPFVPWSEEYQKEYISQVIKSVKEDPRWSGFMLWHFCDANTYTDTVYKTNRPRGFNNKGIVDEYRRPKLAFLGITELLR